MYMVSSTDVWELLNSIGNTGTTWWLPASSMKLTVVLRRWMLTKMSQLFTWHHTKVRCFQTAPVSEHSPTCRKKAVTTQLLSICNKSTGFKFRLQLWLSLWLVLLPDIVSTQGPLCLLLVGFHWCSKALRLLLMKLLTGLYHMLALLTI